MNKDIIRIDFDKPKDIKSLADALRGLADRIEHLDFGVECKGHELKVGDIVIEGKHGVGIVTSIQGEYLVNCYPIDVFYFDLQRSMSHPNFLIVDRLNQW